MATYKGIKGFKVQSLASDPTASETVGKVWYNTAGSVLKYSAEGAGAWSSGDDLNSGRAYGVGTGTNTAALFASGNPGYTTSVESYNGSTWTELSANLTTGRANAIGQGTQTACFFVAGDPVPAPAASVTEIWNGTSWTNGNDINTGRYGASSAGTSTAALAIAGNTYPGPAVNQVESWDGTSWTETSTDLNTARHYLVGFGTTTAAIAATGNVPGVPYSAICESFNGTSWTEVADVNSARQNAGSSGIQTAGVLFGGETYPYAIVGTTNTWDGTSWTVSPASLATARYGVQEGAIGTASATLAVGGQPAMTNTEEWNDPVYAVKTVTTS